MSARWEALRVWVQTTFGKRSRLSTAIAPEELRAFDAQRRSPDPLVCACRCLAAGHVNTCTTRATIVVRTSNLGADVLMCAPCASAVISQWADPSHAGPSVWITSG